MQNNLVLRRGASANPAIREWLGSKGAQLKEWLSGRSEFFTAISGFTVSKRIALQANAALALLMAAAVVASISLAASAAMAVGFAWMVAPTRKGGAR